MRSYLDAGVTVALSSDCPSSHYNPFWGLYSAVTRKGMNGHHIGDAEALTLDEALAGMTLGGAKLQGDSERKGSIEPGKLADLVLLDRDLTAADNEELRDVCVEKTMIDGRLVFNKRGSAVP